MYMMDLKMGRSETATKLNLHPLDERGASKAFEKMTRRRRLVEVPSEDGGREEDGLRRTELRAT